MVSSKIDIVNMALAEIRQNSVSNIDAPVTPTEVLASLHYDVARQAVLEAGVWNFAKRRAIINRDTGNVPAFDYSDRFTLPNDFLRLLRIGKEIDDGFFKTDYDIEGKSLLVNANGGNSLEISYIRDEEDVTKFSAQFTLLVAHKLAELLAFPTTGNAKIEAKAESKYNRNAGEALSIDGQQRPPKRIQRSKYIAARMYGSPSYTRNGYYTVIP